MKLLKRVWLGFFLKVSIVTFLLSGCGGGAANSNTNPPSIPTVESRIEQLWPEIISPYLHVNLWESIYNYDATHVLMIPLHWAYEVSGDASYIQEFEEYFSRYVAEGNLSTETNQLRKLQYLYLHSQYLKVKFRSGRALSENDQIILQELLDEVQYQWLERVVKTYNYPEFLGGMKERLAFKLNTFLTEPEYARAIFDEELFLMAIAADLKVLIEEDLQPSFLADIQSSTYLMFVQEGMDMYSGWLFQPGVWSHYKDYLYSGHTELTLELEPLIIEDVGTDSSHFHRMPLWIKSFMDSYDESDSEYAFFNDIFNRVTWQFENVILVPADSEFLAPRINNYTDGWNGVYRYGFDTVGQNLGYGPYGVSGVLPYSWYAFTSSRLLFQEYQKIEFPLPQSVIELYVGPNTTRERHNLVQWPDYFENGFAELNILLASELLSQPN